MFDIKTKQISWGDDTLTLEAGKIARQADGCVIATLGETTVMAAVTFAKAMRQNQDFFPLTVHYQERYYASGKIPGGFFKREARPTEKETLTSRLIDRPLRPLFPSGYRCEVNVVCTVLSHDLVHDPDIVAMIAASAALTISGVPFEGPIAGARVGFESGRYVLNPDVDSMHSLKTNDAQRLDLVVAGTRDAVMMVESEAYELTEDEMLNAVQFGHEAMQPVIGLIEELASDVATPRFEFQEPDLGDLMDAVKRGDQGQMTAAFSIADKIDRQSAIASARETILASLDDDMRENPHLGDTIKKLEASILRKNIVKDSRRVDGRDLTQVRTIDCEAGLIPRAHGSALFTRGETQALVVTTLGTGEDEQIVDALHGNFRSAFMLHYNFPPYSVGETGRMGPPGRREIGHGKLAWRALQAVLPEAEEFPYTVRVVSEITESNGSSSMATVCGASLSMMDAAVPLKSPVAGVAMGLILEPDGQFAILTDILGDEDHLGDMDFKVAGTSQGITSLQMDIKIAGITPQIMKAALEQARQGRQQILKEMAKALTEASEFSVHAPRIKSLSIPKEKIRDVIGTGGKVIREIVETSGAKVDVNDDGVIKIASADGKAIDKALSMINDIVEEPEIGKIYSGKVVKIMEFGAFVNFFGKRDGLVHISQITDGHLRHPSDVISEGQQVRVKLVGFDNRGRVKLTMRSVDQKKGQERSD